MGGTVAPEKILRELSDLWVSLGREAPAPADAGVLRACSMTFVVLAEESDDVQSLGETIAALMPAHPARALVVRLRGAGERALSERVYAQCWMPFGQRKQICCEQIEITASDSALADLPSIVLPLAVPDFPLILWCRSARLWGLPEFRPIEAMAHKVVVDSAAFADQKAVLPRMAEAVTRGVLLGDLSWTRLTRWREMLAQVFENRQYLAQLPRVSRVYVEFAEPFEALAWYMGAWIADSLADVGVPAELTVAPEADGPSLRVTLSGEGIQVELARQEERLTIVVNALSHCTNLPRPAEHLLLREEAGIVRHDPVFEKALASAARLAYPGDK